MRRELAELAALAEALAGSRERHQETMLLGDAFLAAARAWPDAVFDRLPQAVAYPVAVGAVAGAHGIELEKALAAFLHAYVSQAVSAGIRLGVAGQKDGVAILAQTGGAQLPRSRAGIRFDARRSRLGNRSGRYCLRCATRRRRRGSSAPDREHLRLFAGGSACHSRAIIGRIGV